MVSWPGRLEPRRDKEHLASTLDFWPTLAALLQTPLPKDLPGINLTDAKAVAQRERIFGEQYAHNIADVNAPTRSLERRFIIEGWWKLVAPAPNGAAELYNLQDDPWEKSNLAAKETERVQRLKQQLDKWWKPTTGTAPKPGR
jgi:uncharacterized sulfatase